MLGKTRRLEINACCCWVLVSIVSTSVYVTAVKCTAFSGTGSRRSSMC